MSTKFFIIKNDIFNIMKRKKKVNLKNDINKFLHMTIMLILKIIVL